MKIAVAIIILIVFAFVIGFMPIKEVPYVVIEPLDYTEQSYVKSEDSTVIWGSMPPIGAGPPGAATIHPVGNVGITNTDEIEGGFKVRITFNSGDNKYTNNFDLRLKPGQREDVSLQAIYIDYNSNKWTWEYEITPDKKGVTHYKKVPIFEFILSSL